MKSNIDLNFIFRIIIPIVVLPGYILFTFRESLTFTEIIIYWLNSILLLSGITVAQYRRFTRNYDYKNMEPLIWWGLTVVPSPGSFISWSWLNFFVLNIFGLIVFVFVKGFVYKESLKYRKSKIDSLIV